MKYDQFIITLTKRLIHYYVTNKVAWRPQRVIEKNKLSNDFIQLLY